MDQSTMSLVNEIDISTENAKSHKILIIIVKM